MKKDRFLMGMVIGIGVVVVLAVGLFIARQGQVEYLSADTPNSVVHNFILALTRSDYERAYTYLAEKPNKPTPNQFRQDLTSSPPGFNQTSLSIGETLVDADFATVQLLLSQSYGGPFTERTRYTDTARLERQAGSWKLVSMPYPFWSFNWFVEQPKPLP